MPNPTLYEILEITPRATVEELIAARDNLLFRYHPANNPNDPDAVKKMKKVKLAFSVLSDAGKRQMYDDGLATPAPAPKAGSPAAGKAAKGGDSMPARKRVLLGVLGVVVVSAGGYVGYDTWQYRGKPGGLINTGLGNKPPEVDKKPMVSDLPVKLEAVDQISLGAKTLKVGDTVEAATAFFNGVEEIPAAKPNPLLKSYRIDKQVYVVEFAAGDKPEIPVKVAAIRQEFPMTLHDAAANELDLTGEVQTLLAIGADINAKTGDGTTPLHMAARKGRTEIAKFLIDKGAKVNEPNAEGQTALRFAVGGGFRDTVAALLAKGAEAQYVDQEGNTLLHVAANQNYNEIAALLLEKGVPVDAVNKAGDSALHRAAARANRSLVEMLILKGADPALRNKEGQAPLALVNKNNSMLYNYLLEKTPTDAPKATTEKAKPVAIDPLKLAEEARQIDLAWSRYYKQPGKCDSPVSMDVMRDCVNLQMRARENFEKEWRAGKAK